MPQRPAQSKPKQTAAPQTPLPVDSPDFDYHLTSFWEKYQTPIIAACCVVLAVIVVKGAWDFIASQRQSSVEKAYAEAVTPSMRKAFVADHQGAALSGVAELQIADGAYAANQIPEAMAAYAQASAILQTGPLGSRARLGEAMCKVQSGDREGGEAELRQLANDAQGYKAVRAEAAYHLASIAAAEGHSAEVQNLSTQLMQIDPSSPWTQKVFTLEAEQTVASDGKPGGASISIPSIKP